MKNYNEKQNYVCYGKKHNNKNTRKYYINNEVEKEYKNLIKEFCF